MVILFYVLVINLEQQENYALKISDDRLCKIKMIGEIRQNFTVASASVGHILATALSR